MDVFPASIRSAVMSRIRAKDTTPELVVRRELHRRGYRFRLHDRRLPGKPDIVLPKFRVAIQVRGCFWHQHSCHDGHIPKSHLGYWVDKLKGNKARDAKNDRRLRALGWRLIIVWECQYRNRTALGRTICRIENILKKTQSVARLQH